jgi:hypothetical protein
MEDFLPAGITASFHHVGLVVTDLDAAMAELSRTTGVQWRPAQERPDREGVLRVSFSVTAPHIELIQGNPGGVWSTDNGPHLDHLAFWTDRFEDDCATFTDIGAERETGGTAPFGGRWAYFRLPVSGVRIELCDTAARDAFLERWQLAAQS